MDINTKSSYEELTQKMHEIRILSNSLSILSWDTHTYMPTKGINQRSEQLAILSKIVHSKFTDPHIGKLLSDNKSLPNLSSIQIRNLELWQRDYDKETKIPTKLVSKIAKQSSFTEHLWEEAKQKSDFTIIRPDLEKLVDLIKQKANFLDPDKKPYDVLVDLYEPKITSAEISKYFTPLRERVIKLVKKCMDLGTESHNYDLLKLPTTIDQQKQITKMLMDILGMNPERSRNDEVEHPFTTGYADDVRITTHYLNNDPMASFYSVMHEGGHALYELNLPREHLWTAIGEPISLGFHESQSRFFENIIGKHPDFLKYMLPKIQAIIPSYKQLSEDTFIKAVNAVTPTKIRIYADEVTYNLHVILRFEIEQELFAEKITVAELPQVWNQKMKDYLNIEISKDQEGVLQDTHWYGGLFGYFPTYVLGNIYNAQMLATMKKQIPDWQNQMGMGNITPMRNWVIKNVHSQGALYDPIDLMKKISGEAPSPKYFIDYLEEKFAQIYKS